MKPWFEFVATISTGLFAGAALYITLVEHPARMECGTELAATEFGPSYRRAAVMQASLAAIAFVAAIGAWRTSLQFAWLLGGILIVTAIPFTLIVILPTNKKLLDPSLDRSSDAARQLLIRWGRLHAVRSVLSLTALVVFLLILATTPSGHAHDDRLRLRESVLKQDLFELRSLVAQYTLDKQKAPKSLDDLVQAGYIKRIPIDPMTGESDWMVDRDEIMDPSQHEPGISDVHRSNAISSDGTAYSSW